MQKNYVKRIGTRRRAMDEISLWM